MKFGPVSLIDAEGATLAHSVALTSGRLRKGRVLTARDIDALRRDDIQQVIVARLEPGEIDENNAAARLAQAIMREGAGLEIAEAFTGRANLVATGPGVVALDPAALNAVNAVDPMITIATVPPYQQVAAAGLVATVKIISYGVSEAHLEQACAQGTDAIGLVSPVMRRATLIISEIPGGAADKGRDAIQNRLEALDVTLESVVMVPHATDAIAAAIAQARTELVLILTGSATSDIHDVAPTAVRAAGGTIERFGMPVDPGNLLFIGQVRGTPVIGLPGCARSPALNGADWVLSRVVCGIEVRSEDISAMGVGGLLKEIPTRPQPRRRRGA